MAYIESTDQLILDRLSSLVKPDYSPAELYSDSLQAAHASAAFIERRLLRQLQASPWRLLQGEVEANVRNLSAESSGNLDPGVGVKAKRLLEFGFSVAGIAMGLQLLRYIPWGTRAAEQSHGSLGTVHRFHRFIFASKLAIRAALHQCRAF